MPEKRGPDDQKVHQDYQIEAVKQSKDVWGKKCRDVASVRTHDPAETKRIVEFLRTLGYSVSLERHTTALIEEDEFPEQEEEHGA